MGRELYLENLLGEDEQFRTQLGREIEINKKFVTLFPKPIKKGWFIFGELEYPKLTREQIRETLVRNKLIKRGADPETATNEALERDYDIEIYDDELYRFIELRDGKGNKCYELRLIMTDY